MRVSWLAAGVASLFLTAGAAAEPSKVEAEAQAPDQTALATAATYAKQITPLVNEANALMGDIVEFSDRYLLGFTDPAAYKRDRKATATGLKSLEARVEALRTKAEALPDPPAGSFAARGLDLKRYIEKFAVDVGDMKNALGRLPGHVKAKDAEGFDAARAVLFRYSSNALRAENALLTAGQLTTSIGHPEFHLIEAMKNGNLVIAEFLDLLQRANAGEREGLGAIATQIEAYHKGIGISLDAAAARADLLEAQIAPQAPALSAEWAAFFGAYRAAFGVERRIGSALADYPPMAQKIAGGDEPSSFKARLDEIGAGFGPLIAERQAAISAKQAAGIALAAKAQQ